MARIYRGEKAGWVESRIGRREAPALTNHPRFLEGELEVRLVPLEYHQCFIDGEQVDPHSLQRIERSSVAGYDSWRSAELLWPDDPKPMRDRRTLQSWYRHHVLRTPPGEHAPGKPLGSRLTPEAARNGLNFIHPEIASYAWHRANVVKAEGGTIKFDRLEQDMLSSMPLCFNLFGHLRLHKRTAADVFQRLLGLKMDEVEDIEVEFAPHPPAEYLNDRSAFDAYVKFSSSGKSGFIAVETKYTDKFSRDVYPDLTKPRKDRYSEFSTRPQGFRSDSIEPFLKPEVNQVWRNALLAIAHQMRDGFDPDLVKTVVLSCADDKEAHTGVQLLTHELPGRADFVRHVSYEELIEEFVEYESTEYWAREFQRRYLDLSAISSA